LDAIQARCDVIVGSEEAVAGGLTAVMLIILALSAGSTTQTETYNLNQGESNQMSTNLSPIPNGWDKTYTGQRGLNSPPNENEVLYGAYAPDGATCLKVLAYIHDPYFQGTYHSLDREINGQWRAINPGDTVVFSADIWTGASTIGDSSSYNGGLLFVDAYGSGGRGCQINNKGGVGTPVRAGGVYDYQNDAVPWGSGAWVHKTFSWVVPYILSGDNFGDYPLDEQFTPTGFIPILNSSSSDPPHEGAAVYYKNIELYILASGAYATPVLAAPTIST
jgi:hypothetical protein